MKKRTKILIGVVVIVIVLMAVVTVAASSDDDKTEVRYNYKVELADSFVTSSGYTETADAGKQYVIVTWTVANDSYDDGFSTNDLIFVTYVTANGLQYRTTADNYLHPGYKLETITEGHEDTFVCVYEIPSTVQLSDIEVSYDYQWTYDPPKMERDTSL